MNTTPFKYNLGIDVGVASLGLAVIEIDKEENVIGVKEGFVRTWSAPVGGETRRLARSQRRMIDRKQMRLRRLAQIFLKNGIGFPHNDIPKYLLDKSPLKLRAKAVNEKIDLEELQRIILHMAKHRGSSAFDGRDNDEKDTLLTKEGIKKLEVKINEMGFKTYGQFLWYREKRFKKVRINQEVIGKGGYDFYPSRSLLREEFDIIWKKQKEWYQEKLNDSFRESLEEVLFSQRKVSIPPPGNCSYVTNEKRLPKSSRLFQEKRIYEEVNNLRFSHQGTPLPELTIGQRDKLVEYLMRGESLNKTEIKTRIGIKKNCKVNLEDSKDRTEIAKYPFSDSELGEEWAELNEENKDFVLEILSTHFDKEEAVDKIKTVINLSDQLTKRLIQTDFPKGYGNLGKTATRKIIEELKKHPTLSSRQAEDLAGLVHAQTPTGEIFRKLPYYGEVLKGYAIEPIWIFSENPSNKPPNTNFLEQKFGRAPNPVVHVALNQIRKAVNCLIDKYGLPEKIYVELARDLGKSEKTKAKIEQEIASNRKKREQIRWKLKEHEIEQTRHNELKYELWEQQKHKCVYTGDNIDLIQLSSGEVEIDHILPRSKTYDDSKANKVLCKKSANAFKNNRTPYDAFSSDPNFDWDAIIRRVNDLPPGKKNRFKSDALERFENNPDYWRERFSIDNSYIAKITRQYLTCLYGKPENVIAVSSKVTSLLRKKWGLNKVLGGESNIKQRDDHRHHFIDALVVGCTTRSTIQKIQTAARHCEEKRILGIVDKIQPPFGGEREFWSHVEKVTQNVLLSRKPDNSASGQLHEDTLRGVVSGPNEKGKYLTRTKVKLGDIKSLTDLKKKKISGKLITDYGDIPLIADFTNNLNMIQNKVEGFCQKARLELETEAIQNKNQGKKVRAITETLVYKKAIDLMKKKALPCYYWDFKEQKLVNVIKQGNKFNGGYLSGRNHRMDFYKNNKGKIKWQIITMFEANDKTFVPESDKAGNALLWSAHKDDILLMDDPDNLNYRVRMIVVKIQDGRMGVVKCTDARDAGTRSLYENRLKFFKEKRAQRIITNHLGEPTYFFPMLNE
ncbi:MAG: type II CRISPR RNA-guided endonuclease Cas9 [Rhodobacteraceae bacterium]|nr:type II CRISPR RNA-guided endonuclease Cas9 [Paracoccaceae bacterium]